MKGKLYLSLLSGSSLLTSSTVFAHVDTSGDGTMGVLAHLLAGPHHLPMLILVGIGVAWFVRRQRREGD